MYKSLYQEPINDELLALYNIKNYTNHKNTITVNNGFPDTFLAAQMLSITLAGSPVF